MTRNTISELHGVWGFSSSDVFSTGWSGTIVRYMPPIITSVSLDHGDQGATLDVIITGTNFTGASEVRFGAGIATNSFTVLSSDQIAVNITIVAGATPGVRDISVTTPGGTSELSDTFTIKQALPIITSVSPNQGNQGATIDIIVNGSNLNRVSALSFSSGVAIDSFTNRSSTQIAARITIDENATPGARDVLVDTPGGTSTLGGGFTVKERPLGTFFIALTWLGIALAVVLLGFILNILRRKRAAGL